MQPINRAIPGALAELMKAAPLSAGKVEFAWSLAVGPALQRATSVHLAGAELFVDASTTQWAREVRRAAPVILSRIQTLLGNTAVTSLTVRDRR